jgi:hypothetical protein
MTAENKHDPAATAEIDQLLAGFGTQLNGWVTAMQDQAARNGPDQGLANVTLALSLEPISLPEMRALFVIALQRLAAAAAEPGTGPGVPRGPAWLEAYRQGRQDTTRSLLSKIKQIETPDGAWQGDRTVDLLIAWFGERDIAVNGPGPKSCTECGHIDQPEYWHETAEHGTSDWAAKAEAADEGADDLEGDGEGYDTGSLAKEDERNAWQHTAEPEDGTDPEDGADYTIDKKPAS